MKTINFDEAFYKKEGQIDFKAEEVKDSIFKTLFDEDGYLLIRKFPVDPQSIEQSEKDVLNFSFLFGVPLSQTLDNKFICRVQDERHTGGENTPRGYQTSGSLPYHSDRCDFLMLCGINPSPVGGETLVVSGKKIHQQVSTAFPNDYKVLKRPFPFEKRTGGYCDDIPWYTIPVFSELEDGRVMLWFCEGYMKDSQKHADCPKLTGEQLRAMDTMCSVIQKNKYAEKVNLQRGDVLIMNSLTTLHARNGYPAGSDRLLLRVWISNNNSELPADCIPLFGNIGKGSYRGGLWTNSLNLTMIPQNLPDAKNFIRNHILSHS